MAMRSAWSCKTDVVGAVIVRTSTGVGNGMMLCLDDLVNITTKETREEHVLLVQVRVRSCSE